MSVTADTDSELFAGGPPRRMQQSLGLIKPDNPRIGRRVVLVGLIGWAPLVVLAAVQDSVVL
jgi:hypothetical protein